jgi:hypothetical protein
LSESSTGFVYGTGLQPQGVFAARPSCANGMVRMLHMGLLGVRIAYKTAVEESGLHVSEAFPDEPTRDGVHQVCNEARQHGAGTNIHGLQVGEGQTFIQHGSLIGE